MSKELYMNFLNFLRRAGKVATQPQEILEEYAQRLDAFLEYSRNIDREPIPIVHEIVRALTSNGNYVEAAQVLFDEAKVYLKEDRLKEYYGLLNRGFSVLFAAVFIPEIYTELLNMIGEVKRTKYYPVLFYKKAYVEHVHLHEYELALADYLKVRTMLPDLENDFVNKMGFTDKSAFEWRLSLNMVDVLFKLAMYNEHDSEYYLAMADGILRELQEKFASSKEVAIHVDLFWVQYFITARNPQKAKSILDAVVSAHQDKKWFKNYSSVIAYLNTLYFWSMEDYRSTIRHLKGAIQEAINSGSEIMTKETIDFALFLLERSGKEFSIYSREGEEILNTILGILFSKDWYLGIDHSTKVAELALKISREYSKITGVELDGEKVYMAGLLHDIGKLYVPWYVLNKPSRLNEIEWLCIKYHPVYGREIMEKIGLGEYARYVEEHHERNDGSGYPYGKRNLPPVSQIIGVADIFEAATTSNRFYKSPKSAHEILKELKGMSGTKFDSTVITALIGALGENVKEAVL